MDTSKNSYCFTCIDYSEDINNPEPRRAGVRFTNEEDFKNFEEQVENARKENDKLECFKVQEKK